MASAISLVYTDGSDISNDIINFIGTDSSIYFCNYRAEVGNRPS